MRPLGVACLDVAIGCVGGVSAKRGVWNVGLRAGRSGPTFLARPARNRPIPGRTARIRQFPGNWGGREFVFRDVSDSPWRGGSTTRRRLVFRRRPPCKGPRLLAGPGTWGSMPTGRGPDCGSDMLKSRPTSGRLADLGPPVPLKSRETRKFGFWIPATSRVGGSQFLSVALSDVAVGRLPGAWGFAAGWQGPVFFVGNRSTSGRLADLRLTTKERGIRKSGLRRARDKSRGGGLRLFGAAFGYLSVSCF